MIRYQAALGLTIQNCSLYTGSVSEQNLVRILKEKRLTVLTLNKLDFNK